MKLIMSIVNNEDARPLIDALMRKGHRATVISTTGGFLREGNATIFVGTDDDKVEEVLGAAPGSVRLLREKTIFLKIEPARIERILRTRK